MHTLTDTTQDGLAKLGIGPWEDPRKNQILTLLRPFPERAGQVASEAKGVMGTEGHLVQLSLDQPGLYLAGIPMAS